MNVPADLAYDYPLAVWVFFAAILLVAFSAAIYRFRKRLKRVFNEDLLLSRAPSLYWAKVLALAAAWIFATIALMGPKGNGHYPEEGRKPSGKQQQEGVAKRKAHDVVIAIDASASMDVKDSRNGISRLEYAKQIADQLISRLEGDSVALDAFTYEPALLSPATLDTLYVRLLLRSIKINEGDTAGTSLVHMLEAFQTKYLAKPSQKLITLVLLSDGEDNQIKNVEALQKYIQGPSLVQSQLFTIGMGTTQGGEVPKFSSQSHLEPLPLQFIAQEGRGKYFYANAYTPISLVDSLLGEMDKVNPFVQPGEIPASFLSGGDNLIYDLYFQIPLGLALLCLAFYLLGPNTWKRLSMLLIFLLPMLGNAVDKTQVKDAIQDLEAGLYDKAEEIFTALLNEPLKNWEGSIVTYDWGTGALMKGDPKRALEIFERTPLGGQPSPLLLQNLRTNRAEAFYQVALQEQLDSDDSYEEALFLLREAQAYLRLASDAHCQVVQIEGAEKCELPLDLIQMQRKVQLKLAELFGAYVSLRIANMGVEERLPLLAAELGQLKRGLELIKERPAFRPLIQNDLAEWRPVWENLPAESKTKELFGQAYQKISHGGQVESLLAELEKAIKQETEQAFQNNPDLTKQKVIDGLYQFALLQDPPLPITLHALEEVGEKGNHYLQAAIEALAKGNNPLAKFYLLAAQQSLPVQGDDVKAVLNQAIRLEERALRLNRLLYRTPEYQTPDLQRIVKEAQGKAVAASQPFLASAYETQYARFNDEKEPVEKRCQAQPWNEVFALYNKGREHAIKGNSLSINDQRLAVAYWKEALKLLDKPGSGKGCPDGGGGSASEEIKNVQEMDQEDRTEKKTSAVQVEGVNPW